MYFFYRNETGNSLTVRTDGNWVLGYGRRRMKDIPQARMWRSSRYTEMRFCTAMISAKLARMAVCGIGAERWLVRRCIIEGRTAGNRARICLLPGDRSSLKHRWRFVTIRKKFLNHRRPADGRYTRHRGQPHAASRPSSTTTMPIAV